MDKMIGKMRQDMQKAMTQPMQMNLGSHGMGKGRFSQMQTITKTRADQHGNPTRETYQTKA